MTTHAEEKRPVATASAGNNEPPRAPPAGFQERVRLLQRMHADEYKRLKCTWIENPEDGWSFLDKYGAESPGALKLFEDTSIALHTERERTERMRYLLVTNAASAFPVLWLRNNLLLHTPVIGVHEVLLHCFDGSATLGNGVLVGFLSMLPWTWPGKDKQGVASDLPNLGWLQDAPPAEDTSEYILRNSYFAHLDVTATGPEPRHVLAGEFVCREETRGDASGTSETKGDASGASETRGDASGTSETRGEDMPRPVDPHIRIVTLQPGQRLHVTLLLGMAQGAQNINFSPIRHVGFRHVWRPTLLKPIKGADAKALVETCPKQVFADIEDVGAVVKRPLACNNCQKCVLPGPMTPFADRIVITPEPETYLLPVHSRGCIPRLPLPL